MNKIKSLVLSAIGLLCSLSVSAEDFEVDGIYYNILSESDKTVEVTYKGNSSDAYSDEYYFHETIPSTVTYGGITYTVIAIGEQAFLSCKGVTGITIPNTVTSIGWRAFHTCTSLNEIICKSKTPVTIGASEFYLVPTTAVLYVPKGSKNAYVSATGWSKFKNIIEFSLIPEYTITYMVDGEEYYSETIESGAEIPVIDAPAKEGYTFSGWENIPSNMPDEDITVYAKYTPNNYTVSFKANGEIVYSELLAYGTTIVAPDAPEIEDYAFVEWLDLLETVPAHDVEFVAAYKQVGVRIADGVNSFTQEENKAYDKITYTRTLPNLHWNALYVPFELLYDVIAEHYDVAYINDVNGYDTDDNGTIDDLAMEIIKIKGGTLKANYPYLIKAKTAADKAMNITVENATLYAAAENSVRCSSVYQNYAVTGIYTKKTAEELAGKLAISTSGAWQPLAAGTALNPFRLYLSIENLDDSPLKVETSAMSRMRIVEHGETTGVETITPAQQREDVIIDLSGRRVKQPVKGGVYIINGKKQIF